MKKSLLILSFLSLFSTFGSPSHESDLSESLSNHKSQDYFRPDNILKERIRNNTISIKAILVKEGVETPLKGFSFNLNFANKSKLKVNLGETIECENNQKFSARAKLLTDGFSIQNSRRDDYELLFSGSCGSEMTLVFDYKSLGGEFFGVWNIARKVNQKFVANGLEDVLSSKIRIRFPSNGDYYNGTVHVTKGYQWDVVGHEIGHAIYSRARIGRSAGGRHRIDECYSKALALSEGWASFFSAWVSVDLNDPDAKFEYMVPRRAPLEIEHVPADVCVGPNNEWRVYSFLWDLIDLNNDNENINLSFLDLWNLSAGVIHRDINSFKDALLSNGFDPVIVNIVWDQNILNI
jgi:hypothetical protein